MCYLCPRWWVVLHAYLLYFESRMWWCIRTIRMIRVLHSLQGLQFCCSHWHNAWRCLCCFPAKRHMLPLHYCYILDTTLFSYMCSFGMLSLISMQSLLQIYRLPLHLLWHHSILQVWNILSNFYTLQYYALRPPNYALIHHWLAMLLSPQLDLHCHHHHLHIVRHQGFPGQTSPAQIQPAVVRGQWGWRRTCCFCHLHFIFPIAPWHSERYFPIHAIIVCCDVWVSASDLKLLKPHFRG